MDKANITKKYTNGEVTIVWKPGLCHHSAICWKHPDGMIKVFNPSERPWIKPENGSTDEIITQVKKCPSGALGYFMNSQETENEKVQETELSKLNTDSKIEILPNGPYLVTGQFCIIDSEGKEKGKNSDIFLCRCGASNNKPFCDGSHAKVGFNDSK
jgi:uncharacterized Fe-S cluster protein YjdI